MLLAEFTVQLFALTFSIVLDEVILTQSWVDIYSIESPSHDDRLVGVPLEEADYHF